MKKFIKALPLAIAALALLCIPHTEGQAGGSLKAAIFLLDTGEAVSTTQGFTIPYRVTIVNASGQLAAWESAALVPFAPSVAQIKTAIQNIVDGQAAAFGYPELTANDMTIVGGLM